MPYTAEISRSNPTLLVIMVDQSGSMSDPVGNSGASRRKSQELSDAVNRLLQNLSIKCAKEEGVRDYFHIALIGYANSHAGPAFAEPLTERDTVPLSEVADNPARLEPRCRKVSDGAGGLVEQQVQIPIWLDPTSSGGTPMSSAFRKAIALVTGWVAEHPTGFPPLVLNVTDGEPTDGDPSELVQKLRELATSDGPVLVFNLHISSTSGQSTTFPDCDATLADDYARRLFAMSSILPAYMRSYVAQQGISVAEGSRGFVFNADVAGIVQFFDIGTRVAIDLR